MMNLRVAITLALACSLQACASDRPVGLDLPLYGGAVRANIAAQTVNPMAPVDRGPLVANGERAAVQQERYVEDMVETPMEVGTLQGLQGGGGGGGAGGGGAGGGASAGPAAGLGAAAAP
jgi:hypothetical protein